jgi:hypothetical protein
MPVILATQEIEIRRIMVPSHPREIVHKTLFQKKKHHENRARGVAQGVGRVQTPAPQKKEYTLILCSQPTFVE